VVGVPVMTRFPSAVQRTAASFTCVGVISLSLLLRDMQMVGCLCCGGQFRNEASVRGPVTAVAVVAACVLVGVLELAGGCLGFWEGCMSERPPS